MTLWVKGIPVGVAWFLALELLRKNFLVALPRDGRGLASFDLMLVNGRALAKTHLFKFLLTYTEIPLMYCEAFLFHDQVVSEELVPLTTLK